MPSNLLPCPFCGSKATIHRSLTERAGSLSRLVGCENVDCYVSPILAAENEVLACERWNTRVPTGSAVLTALGRHAAKQDDDATVDDPSITRDLILLLVDIPRDVDAPAFAASLLDRVSAWPPAVRDAVEEWCAAAHLSASDNDVAMPRQPEHLTALLYEIRHGGIK